MHQVARRYETLCSVQPSSPDASSASGESSAAMMEASLGSGGSHGDDIEWLHGSHKDQLRR